jgi:putative glutamine amidotransferase
LKPIIGISAGRSLSNNQITQISLIENYVLSVKKAGGIPLILPANLFEEDISQIASNIDGFLITGGGDIETSRYNGIIHPKVSNVDSDRDNLEFNIVELSFKHNIPLLGICRGIQVINVALGGNLYSDIPSQFNSNIRHDLYPGFARDIEAHSVVINEDSQLERIFSGNNVNVNSLHHQGIKKLGAGLKATAFAPDGMIEAIEAENHSFLIGVQWHPEWMQKSPAMCDLFKAFINATGDN